MKIGFKEFNNKSRKGTYLYIKGEGKAGRYYKFHQGDNIDGIVAYYESNKKYGNLNEYKRESWDVFSGKRGKKSAVRTHLQQVKRKKHLGKHFKDVMTKGLGNAVLTDLHKASSSDIKAVHEQLLSKIVLDPEIRSLVAEEENIKKLSSRIEISLEVYGSDGLLDVIKVFNHDLYNARDKVTKYLKIGLEVTEASGTPYPDLLKLSQLGKNDVLKEGLLTRIDAKLLFRKN